MDTLLTNPTKTTKTEVRARSLGLVTLILEKVTVILSLERLYRGTNDYSLFKLANPEDEDLSSEERLVCPQLSWGWAKTNSSSLTSSPFLPEHGVVPCNSLRWSFRPLQDRNPQTQRRNHISVLCSILHTHVSRLPILALRWIDPTRLAYLTTSHHIVMMDTVSKSVLQDVDITLMVVVVRFPLIHLQQHHVTPSNTTHRYNHQHDQEKRGAQNGIATNPADGETCFSFSVESRHNGFV